MIINLNTCGELKSHTYSSLPIKSNIIKTFRLGKNIVYIASSPSTEAEDNLVSIDYSFMLYDDKGKRRFVLSLERINLREMSQLLQVSYRALQAEYNTKSSFAEPHIVLYSSENKEDYGAYTESIDQEFLFPFLWDILLDAVDSTLDPEEIIN